MRRQWHLVRLEWKAGLGGRLESWEEGDGGLSLPLQPCLLSPPLLTPFYLTVSFYENETCTIGPIPHHHHHAI